MVLDVDGNYLSMALVAVPTLTVGMLLVKEFRFYLTRKQIGKGEQTFFEDGVFDFHFGGQANAIRLVVLTDQREMTGCITVSAEGSMLGLFPFATMRKGKGSAARWSKNLEVNAVAGPVRIEVSDLATKPGALEKLASWRAPEKGPCLVCAMAWR